MRVVWFLRIWFCMQSSRKRCAFIIHQAISSLQYYVFLRRSRLTQLLFAIFCIAYTTSSFQFERPAAMIMPTEQYSVVTAADDDIVAVLAARKKRANAHGFKADENQTNALTGDFPPKPKSHRKKYDNKINENSIKAKNRVYHAINTVGGIER